jgi:HEAT repeat protein
MILAMSVENRCWLPNVILVCLIGVGCAGAWPSQASAPNPSTTTEALSPEMRALIAKLQEASAEVRAAGARELGEMGQEGVTAIPLLIDLLKDTRPVREGESVAAVASAALVSMGKPAAEACLAALIERRASPQADMLRRTIGQFKDEDVIDVFLGHMTDSDPKIRNTTVISVMYSTDPRLVPGLIDCFKDRDEFVRLSAVGHFRKHRDARAVEPLLDALTHEDKTMRTRAAEALGKQGDRRAIPDLLARIHDDTEAAAVQSRAAESLGQIGGPDVFDSLFAIVEKGPEPTGQRPGAGGAMSFDGRIVSADLMGRRLGAIRGLGHLGDRRAAESLRSILLDREEYGPVRLAAGSSLLRMIDDTEKIRLLVDIVMEPSEDPIVRSGLGTALVKATDGAIDDVAVVTALCNWLHVNLTMFAEEASIELTIPALEAIAKRGAKAEVRAAAKEHLAEAKQRLEKLRSDSRND